MVTHQVSIHTGLAGHFALGDNEMDCATHALGNHK